MDTVESIALTVTRSAPKKTLSVGNPLLRQKSEPVPLETVSSLEVQVLLKDMVDAMRDEKGIGLAAPQIGVLKRLIVVHVPEQAAKRYLDCAPIPLQAIINPEVSIVEPRLVTGVEGCLSVPHYQGIVERPFGVGVTGYDECGRQREWTFSGYNARLILHEFDHLNGELYIDKVLRKNGALELFHSEAIREKLESLKKKKDAEALAYYALRVPETE